MKKICLFSTKVSKGIEGVEAKLYVNFYLVLNRNYIFTFSIDAPNLACSNRNPIKLWKDFLILLEEENVKYMRRYEKVERYKDCFQPKSNENPSSSQLDHNEEVAKAFQLGLSFGFIDGLKNQEEKIGHWVEETVNEWGHKVFCSECGGSPPFEYISNGDVYSSSGYGVINKTKFCPNCGAKMVKPQESEVEKNDES